jgi:nitroreductase
MSAAGKENRVPHTDYEALLGLCEGRHSVREFSSRPVSQENIRRILAVAATAPYASGKKNWDILVITDPALRQRMVEAVRESAARIGAGVREEFRTEYARYAENFSAFESAPLILVPTCRVAPSLSLMYEQADAGMRQWERDNSMKSIACVSMLTLLAAQAVGLSGCFMTGPLLAESTLAAIVGTKPGRTLAAIIPIGYPEKDPENGH